MDAMLALAELRSASPPGAVPAWARLEGKSPSAAHDLALRARGLNGSGRAEVAGAVIEVLLVAARHFFQS
ncbi:hypothetical protein [Botrimarina sp.]|uniref:hypothetical protein n=1 Tax=Botrimarina sp. TaxID=2795802 RepID=UPI0032EC912E